MSESKEGPRVFLQKPKRSRRPPPESSSSISKGDGASGIRSVSTVSSEPAPPPIKQPFWYRFRAAVGTLLVVNAVVIGYTVFRTWSKPSQTAEEAVSAGKTATESEKDQTKSNGERPTERAQVQEVHRDGAAAEKEKKPRREEFVKEKADDLLTQSMSVGLSKVPEGLNISEKSKQKISIEEQQELFQWLLAEKRKMKPSKKAEKAQIDAEKALLKEFLRGKRALDV